ncbi:hypothetical protein Rs2_46891 [Raphanus sativus]|nr:hypothetical protein Rs2_46891 [Raphanus sativus]
MESDLDDSNPNKHYPLCCRTDQTEKSLYCSSTGRIKCSLMVLDYTAQEIINKSIKDAKEWNYAQTDQTDVSRLGPPSWKVSTRSVCPPTSFQSGVLVCKVDAAWEATTGRCGIGGIFSGGEVQTLSTVSEAFSHVSSALMAEAIVIHCAVSLAVYSNARSLAVLTDFLSMINLLKTKRHQPELFDIMFDIYHFISLFDVITFD